MTRTQVRAGRIAAVVVAAALVVAVAGRAAGGPPSGSRVGGAASGGPVAGAASGSVHVVRQGDTLWGIARARVGPDADPRPMVDALREANGLETAVLQPGATLVVPPGP